MASPLPEHSVSCEFGGRDSRSNPICFRTNPGNHHCNLDRFRFRVLGLVFVLIAVLLGCNRCFVLLKCLEKLLPACACWNFRHHYSKLGSSLHSLVHWHLHHYFGRTVGVFLQPLIVSLILLIQCVIENRFSNKINRGV